MADKVGETPTNVRCFAGQTSRQRKTLQFMETESLISEQALLKLDSMFQGVEAKRCKWADINKRSEMSRVLFQERLDQLLEVVRKLYRHELD